MDAGEARDLALGRPGAEEYDHFGKPAYRIGPKKKGAKPGRTFMTLWIDEGYAVLMLDQEQQARLLEQDPEAFRPHPSKWGEKGATIAQFSALQARRFAGALQIAYDHAAR